MANLPPWTEELKSRYLRGEAIEFVLHGNVNDVVLVGDRFLRLPDFLSEVVLGAAKDVVIQYDLAAGVRFAKKAVPVPEVEALLAEREPSRVLAALDKTLLGTQRVGLVLDYAEMIAPAGDVSFTQNSDRQSVITLQRWSFSPAIERADSLVLLVTENLRELNDKVVANPTTAILQVPMPEAAERREAIGVLCPALDASWLDRLAEITAGLRLVQIKAILAPEHGPALDTLTARDRESKGPDDATLQLIQRRKREILERECYGMIEFVEPRHDFSVVGGMPEAKAELIALARNLRQGGRARCPMGVLFVGPMGTGKTFVAEAFVRETGFTGIKLKNFRSKWVGSTEGNLEKILSVVQAIGQVVVIIDEGDRAIGGQGDEDGGTSSRVIARLKEFMSDTSHRGRVLFVVMTNRPDKLDVDIKRAGRLDRKIPFFYPQTAEEVEAILQAQLLRHGISHSVAFPEHRQETSAWLVGYSAADLEAVVLLANDYAAGQAVSPETLGAAVRDYLPARDLLMLEYMELLAVFEASNRRMLPKKYETLGADELQARVLELRAAVGGRR